jgi:hypothetical protein
MVIRIRTPSFATGLVFSSLTKLLDVFLRFVAHVPIPTQKDIEEALLRRKKQELLEMYALDVDMEVTYHYTPAHCLIRKFSVVIFSLTMKTFIQKAFTRSCPDGL